MVLLAGVVSIAMTSCLNIYETYWFNEDGSGTMELKMDVSKMVEAMEAFASELDSAGGGGPNDMFEETEDFESLVALEDQGITNVVNLNDADKKIVGYRFDFKDIDALNIAMRTVRNTIGGMGDKNSGVDLGDHNFFSWSGSKFVRDDPNPEKKDKEDEDDSEGAEMAKEMFREAEYQIVYNFKGKKVKKCSHKGSEIASDKRSVTIDLDFVKMMEGEDSGDATLKVK